MSEADPVEELNPIIHAIKELERVKHEPRMLVIVTHGFIELMVNTLIDARCKNAKRISGSNRDYSHSVKCVLLHELGVLSDHEFNILDWFRKLRNEAAHKAKFKLTAERLDAFMMESHRDPSKFQSLCSVLLYDLLMAHTNELFPVLAPTAGPIQKTGDLPYNIFLKTDPVRIVKEQVT